MRNLTSAREVITVLGGIPAVAKKAQADVKSVYRWIDLNAFPARNFDQMIKALKKKGCTAPASMWGQIGAEKKTA
jgi:DNA-binding phage protein